jgi:hypothetical protein
MSVPLDIEVQRTKAQLESVLALLKLQQEKVELLSKAIMKDPNTCRVQFQRSSKGKVYMCTASVSNQATEQDLLRMEALGLESLARHGQINEDDVIEELAKKRTGRENSRYYKLKNKFDSDGL